MLAKNKAYIAFWMQCLHIDDGTSIGIEDEILNRVLAHGIIIGIFARSDAYTLDLRVGE